MRIKSTRLYPYPVLSKMYDSYVDSEFKISVKVDQGKKKTTLKIDSSLDNEEMLELIKNKDAKIICHFECPKTKLRYAKEIILGENIVEISNSNYDEALEVVAFVIASRDISNYYSKHFNEDYGKTTFNLESGSILAISEQFDIPIEKGIYDLSKVPSIISVIPYQDGNQHEIKIDMDNDKIMVMLQKDEYQKYSEVGKGVSDFTPILHSIIIIPALTYVFDKLKVDEDSFYEYESKRWFKALEKKLTSLDIKFDYESLADIDSLHLAQKLIETPIVDALTNLLTLGGN